MANIGKVKKAHAILIACAVIAIIVVGYVAYSYALGHYGSVYTGIVSSVKGDPFSSRTIITMQDGHIFYTDSIATYLQEGKQYTIWYEGSNGINFVNYFEETG